MRSLIAAKVFEDQESSKSWAVKIYSGNQEDFMPEEPTVAFYDFDLRGETFGEFGQFTYSYYAETLLENHALNQGLCLDGAVEVWSIGGEAYDSIIMWVRQELNRYKPFHPGHEPQPTYDH